MNSHIDEMGERVLHFDCSHNCSIYRDDAQNVRCIACGRILARSEDILSKAEVMEYIRASGKIGLLLGDDAIIRRDEPQ